jgi:hypothetical protein
MSSSYSESQIRLMTALDFDEPDLDANAHGLLSKRQREKLKKKHSRFIYQVCTALIPVILVPSFLIDFDSHIDWKIPAICGGVLLAWLIQILQLHFNNRMALRVETVEGLVYPIRYQQKLQLREHFIQVGDMRFLVEAAVYDAFEYGDPYRIYYATGSNTILSAESLSSTQSSALSPDF